MADVVALIRGGGLLEDAGPQHEPVAERGPFFRCRLPVVSAGWARGGHDHRRSGGRPARGHLFHAAQMLWTERAVLRQQADEIFLALTRGMDRLLDLRERDLQRHAQALAWHSPARRIERGGFELERLTDRLYQAMRAQVKSRSGSGATGGPVVSILGPARVLALHSDLDRAQGALDQAGKGFLRASRDSLREAEGRLSALDPAAPLARGYALVKGASGFVRSRADVRAGDEIRVQVADGEFSAEVLP